MPLAPVSVFMRLAIMFRMISTLLRICVPYDCTTPASILSVPGSADSHAATPRFRDVIQ